MFKHSMRILSTLLVVFGARAVCLAGGGDLDPSFGSGGLVTTDFGSAFDTDFGYALAIQADVTVLTFDDLSLPNNTIITDQYSDQGVIFSPLNGELELRTASFPIFPEDPQGLAEIPYFTSVIIADFLSSANAVGAWIDFGNIGNGVIIEAFDGSGATGNLLASATTTAEEFLGVEADGIQSVRFMKVPGGAVSFLIDHFTFELELACPWDLNGDGEVNVADLLLLLVVDLTDLRLVPINFGPCDGCPEDVNGDGVFDVEDVIAVAMHFGPCP